VGLAWGLWRFSAGRAPVASRGTCRNAASETGTLANERPGCSTDLVKGQVRSIRWRKRLAGVYMACSK